MENPATSGFWLSPQQKHVWMLQQAGQAYRSVCLIEIEGPQTAETILAKLERIASRHDILRTVYVRQPGMKFPFQSVLDRANPTVETVDLVGLSASEQPAMIEELFQQEQVRSFGPEQAPFVAAKLVSLGSSRNALLISFSAMSVDRHSLRIVARELEQTASEGPTTPEQDPLRYVQFAQWQNDLIEGDDENAAKGREFWARRTESGSPLAIPNERNSTTVFVPQVLARNLDSETCRALETQQTTLKASSAEILLAAWQSLLHRLTGRSSFPVGVGFEGREYDELRDTVGPIAKSIPVGARFDGNFRFREVVEHVRSAMNECAEWQEYYIPGTGFGTEQPVSFEFQVEPSDSAGQNSSLSVERVFTCQDSYKLKLLAVQGSNGLVLEFHFDGSRFDPEFVHSLAGYYERLLTTAVSDPEAYVSALPLLDDAERHKLIVEWNQTSSAYPRDKCFHELFEAQVVLTPRRVALRCNESTLTYQQLNEQANQIAHYLRALGVGPDSLVGVCLERSTGILVGLLGILKAGGAYVPLNPDNPKHRLSRQLVGAVALITEQKLLEALPEFEGKTICLDRDEDCWRDQPHSDPIKAATANSLAYVIYTSGSTGVPKGVAVRHRNLVNYSCFIGNRLGLSQHTEGLDFATVSTIGADLGNTCIFPALASGGCLHIVTYDDSTDPQRFARYLNQHPVDVLKIVPSHLQALLESSEGRELLPRKFLILGGEIFTPNLMEKIESLDAGCEILNHYGPTETTVGSLTLPLADYDWKSSRAASIPIGRPIANTQVYILDGLLQPVPVGTIGELFIGGDGVAGGYINQTRLTDERFLPNPFVPDTEARMYRTGDLARYLADGYVEFLGRGDDQIKIRGFRIELGEIESALLRKTGVKQAAVLARDDARGDKRLVAYVVVDREQNNSPEELRAHLKEQLPDYMVPAAIVILTKIPLTANGKIDRQTLPEPEAVETKVYIAPKTPEEESVANIWTEVLRRERISVDDNFFDLGGHSLLATLVVSRIREQFRVELPIRALFDSPTIRGLAGTISDFAAHQPQSRQPAIVRVSRDAYRADRS